MSEYRKISCGSIVYYVHREVDLPEDEREWIKFADHVVDRDEQKVLKSRVPIQSIFDMALGV